MKIRSDNACCKHGTPWIMQRSAADPNETVFCTATGCCPPVDSVVYQVSEVRPVQRKEDPR